MVYTWFLEIRLYHIGCQLGLETNLIICENFYLANFLAMYQAADVCRMKDSKETIWLIYPMHLIQNHFSWGLCISFVWKLCIWAYLDKSSSRIMLEVVDNVPLVLISSYNQSNASKIVWRKLVLVSIWNHYLDWFLCSVFIFSTQLESLLLWSSPSYLFLNDIFSSTKP